MWNCCLVCYVTSCQGDENCCKPFLQVTVYDAQPSSIQRSTVHWTIDEDLVDFPVVSQLNFMTIRWKVDGISSGRLTFVLHSSLSLSYTYTAVSYTHLTLPTNREV